MRTSCCFLHVMEVPVKMKDWMNGYPMGNRRCFCRIFGRDGRRSTMGGGVGLVELTQARDWWLVTGV